MPVGELSKKKYEEQKAKSQSTKYVSRGNTVTVQDKLTWAQRTNPLRPHLEFDGRTLTGYGKNGKVKTWDAMSGHSDYQCKTNTNVKGKGPIPEGVWDVKRNQLQHWNDISLKSKMASYLSPILKPIRGKSSGEWPGGPISWGEHRIWLKPEDGTDNQNRTDLTIHGGWDFGSAGCIDLAKGMNDFINWYQEQNDDMKLFVRYFFNCWSPH